MANSDETQGQASTPDKDESKDFVEHLRTVHFTLVTVCLALVVILQFPSPVSIREAIRQLNTIEDATNMHVWKDRWITDGVPAQLGNVEGFSSCIRPVASDFGVVAGNGQHVSFHFDNANWVLQTANRVTLSESYIQDANGNSKKKITLEAPKRLDEFREVWNNTYSIICPLNIADEMIVGYINSFRPPRTVVETVKRTSVASPPVVPMLTPGGVSRFSPGSLPDNQAQPPDKLFYSVFFPLMLTAHSNANDILRAVDIPISGSKVFKYDFRGVLIKELPGYHWLHADFKNAFYELDQATTGFQDLDFEHIRNILLQNEKNSKESFQAFGVTFPIETTTRWATIIIIAIQFYFLLHLTEYRKRHFGKTDVAWIGSYTSPWARVLFCLTALAVPVGVITFACINAGLLPDMPIRNFMICSLAVVVSLLLSLLTAKDYFRKDAVTPTSPRAAAG